MKGSINSPATKFLTAKVESALIPSLQRSVLRLVVREADTDATLLTHRCIKIMLMSSNA